MIAGMSNRARVVLLSTLCLCALTACSGSQSTENAPAGTAAPGLPAPPDVAAAPADASRTASGLATKVLAPGTGTQHPRPNSQVTVPRISGWTTDGKMFESSVVNGQPVTFGLDEVIPGWTEGVQMMVVGEKRRF